MKKSNLSNGRKENREKLSEIVPLKKPFLLTVEPTTICNFKCNYCFQSGTNNLVKEHMKWDTFLLTMKQAVQLAPEYEIINLFGMGEPLLNPRIAEMVHYISTNNIAKRIEITTNASCLTNKMSLDLINAGLTRLIISIQGINDTAYQKTCGLQMNFQELVAKIKFFYLNKKNCNLHIKTVDTALSQGEEKKFYEVFGDICDSIYIEHTIPFFDNVDYTSLLSSQKSRYGYNLRKMECCPLIFYNLLVRTNGNVAPCCFTPSPVIFGNIKYNSLKQIWDGIERRNFIKMHLRKQRNQNSICQNCIQPDLASHPLDSLDDEADNILKRLE